MRGVAPTPHSVVTGQSNQSGPGAPLPRPATRSPAEGKMAELVRYKGWPRVFLWLPFLVMDEVLGQFILGSVLKKAVAK